MQYFVAFPWTDLNRIYLCEGIKMSRFLSGAFGMDLGGNSTLALFRYIFHINMHNFYHKLFYIITFLHCAETFDNALGRPYTRDEVIYDFVLRRKPDHYMYTVAAPCFIITTLAIIGLFAPFSSTGERQEKVKSRLFCLIFSPRSYVLRYLLA